ncbi:TPA: hypothetical protein JRW62_003427 [Elizabethkingia meningoseptica]|uniref:hypothetical protein n=1 Tax=Elizabethkingia meningoseptica TaxID=238 RepID=UPI0022F17E01|nr:hypothetical protein [Elizabethkingia meningoseptica]EJK5328729.1 hypothetical protein [Elizabethkingia meningoseptica]WBS75340.1 hypothetical protein PF438_02360 [Elizabethkingia meningoseptica]HAY3564385.1 hypothetical protein [Elizabethkingia meningoseptica]
MLNLLKKYIVDSQFYVSFMGTLLTLFFMTERTSFRIALITLIFLTFLNGYLYTKYQMTRKIFGYVLLFNTVTFIFCITVIIHRHHPESLIKWLLILILGFLYNTRFLDTYIRKIPFIKIFHVALVWALVNSWLIMPAIQWDVFFITFFLVSGLILPFDIRDMQYDTVTTFPQIIGIQNTKYLAYLLLFVSSLIAAFYLQPDFAVCYFLAVVVGFIFIYFARPTRPDAYFSFGVETVSGLPFLFYLLLKLF